MMSHLKQAYDYDVRIRIQNDGASSEGVALLVKDISEGVVYEKGGVKVTAFEVDHAPVQPAFGYRIDYAGRSVVLSVGHDRERARLEASGRSAPYVDGQIASIAHVNELVLVTANARDFARFKDLKVEDWTRAGRRR